MKSTLFDHNENTKQEDDVFALQNSHMLLVNLDGDVYAKQGSMAAYQGEMEFKFHGGGVSRWFKKAVTGENLQLMQAIGKGDLFLADNGSEVHIVNIEDEQLTVNNSNLLAFESKLTWDVSLIKAGMMGLVAGGLFNITLTGSGKAALTSWGNPVVINVDQPTYVDVNCVIAWSSSLKVSIHSSFKAGALIGRGSGEAFQMEFEGTGFVVVQPGEGLSGLLKPGR